MYTPGPFVSIRRNPPCLGSTSWRGFGVALALYDCFVMFVIYLFSAAWRLECVSSAGFRPRSSPPKLAAVKRNICVSRVLLSADFVTVANRFHCGHGVC